MWFDPFGQPVDPVSGLIGTGVADDAVVDNVPGEADWGWVGQHQRLYEHAGELAAVEMGARVFVPALGRFLSVDPVEGGVDNAYVYPTNPVNDYDLNGEFAIAIPVVLLAVVAAVALLAVYAVWQHCRSNACGAVQVPTSISFPTLRPLRDYIFSSRESRRSGKERATDVPSYASGATRRPGESVEDAVKRARAVRKIFVLLHLHESNQDVKMIGCFSSVEAAEEAKSALLRAPGFESAPDSFWMVEVPIGVTYFQGYTNM